MLIACYANPMVVGVTDWSFENLVCLDASRGIMMESWFCKAQLRNVEAYLMALALLRTLQNRYNSLGLIFMARTFRMWYGGDVAVLPHIRINMIHGWFKRFVIVSSCCTSAIGLGGCNMCGPWKKEIDWWRRAKIMATNGCYFPYENCFQGFFSEKANHEEGAKSKSEEPSLQDTMNVIHRLKNFKALKVTRISCEILKRVAEGCVKLHLRTHSANLELRW